MNCYQKNVPGKPNVPMGCGLIDAGFTPKVITSEITGFHTNYDPDSTAAYDFYAAMKRGAFNKLAWTKVIDNEDKNLALYKLFHRRILNVVNYLLSNQLRCRTCPIAGLDGCKPSVYFDQKNSGLTILPEIPEYLRDPNTP